MYQLLLNFIKIIDTSQFQVSILFIHINYKLRKNVMQSEIYYLKNIFNDDYLSLFMRKPSFRLCENKDADQLRGNCEADQRLCFRYMVSIIPILPKSEISSL